MNKGKSATSFPGSFLYAKTRRKTLAEAGHLSRGFRVINLKYTVGGAVEERVFVF